MSAVILAGFLLAQAPVAVSTHPQSAATKKPAQVCQMIEVTGSRARKRVCRDDNGVLDLGPGVTRGAPNSSIFRAGPSGTGEPKGQGMTPG